MTIKNAFINFQQIWIWRLLRLGYSNLIYITSMLDLVSLTQIL
jgi:hypothetical protein